MGLAMFVKLELGTEGMGSIGRMGDMRRVAAGPADPNAGVIFDK